jgi:hypothetical protein
MHMQSPNKPDNGFFQPEILHRRKLKDNLRTDKDETRRGNEKKADILLTIPLITQPKKLELHEATSPSLRSTRPGLACLHRSVVNNQAACRLPFVQIIAFVNGLDALRLAMDGRAQVRVFTESQAARRRFALGSTQGPRRGDFGSHVYSWTDELLVFTLHACRRGWETRCGAFDNGELFAPPSTRDRSRRCHRRGAGRRAIADEG